MSDTLLDFAWPVAKKYRWIDLPAIALKPSEKSRGIFREFGPTHVLVEADTTSVRRYEPMDRAHATLFRSFASLEPTRTDVQAFAREFGRLGPPITRKIRRLSQEVEDGEELVGHMGLHGWTNSIFEMRFAIDLWQAIQDANPQRVPPGDPFASLVISPIGAPSPPPPPPAKLPVEEVIPDARRRLAGIVTKQFALSNLLDSGPIVGPQLTVAATGDFRLSYAPRTLLGAMWMQFAMAIAEGKQYPPCKHCNRPIEISKGPTGFRVDREFCSARCKTADYRARRAKAGTLRKSRRPLGAIARELNTSVATLRRWLAD